MRYRLRPKEKEFCETVVCAGFHAAKYHTFALVEDLLDEGVQGDFAECGVMAGAHPAIMLYVLRKYGVRNRLVHMFDSFQGIPRATIHDAPDEHKVYGVLPEGKMESSGISISSVENTINNLQTWGVYDPELVRVHAGWFEETLAVEKDMIDKLAFLRVDVDLYQSTKTVYQQLYPKVVAGGFVCDDDYGVHHAYPACRRAMESVIGRQEAIDVEGQTTTSWWRKP